MKREWTPEEIERHDALYAKGFGLIDGLILLGAAAGGRPGWFARRRLVKARSCFVEVIRMRPDAWQVLFALGKIEQRLGNREEAFGHFQRAHEIDPTKPL
jgi:tetratricopeptide (TPR) repeat protein